VSIRLIPILAALLVAIALAPTAGAAQPETTEPNALKIIDVLVNAKGATFGANRLERGSIADFRIKNRTKRSIRLQMAGVRSAVVRPGHTTSFFVHFDVRGRTPWTLLVRAQRADRGTFLIY
jgi:hypothetical protein